jgi:hypothetical protein
MTFDVFVVDDDGDPVAGVRVRVQFTSILRGYIEAYADDDGHAEFDEDVNPGEAMIYVRGESFGPYNIDDGDGYTVTT